MKLAKSCGLVAAATLAATCAFGQAAPESDRHVTRTFNRVATFPAFLNTNIETPSVAEIVAASKNGKTLVYTDGVGQKLGFVDISDPHSPQPAGALDLPGEPTSVTVFRRYALVAVNTSLDFVNTSGQLVVVDIDSHAVLATHELGGQPDSIDVSPDGRYAAVVIENERDEDLGDGRPPQAPAGFLVIVDLKGRPDTWTTRTVDFTGVPDLFPDDAEPEYVDINRRNLAVVSFQENNHIALVNLKSGEMVRDFSAGTADLDQVDVLENELIELKDSLTGIKREPDAIAWLSNRVFATADEGDLDGGSRGITLFRVDGSILYEAGNELEHAVARAGHYPEDRSENKGNEPEGLAVGTFAGQRYLFVTSERSSVVFVYTLNRRGGEPRLVQTLPASVGPEGLAVIEKRGLVVVSGEEDAREDGVRGGISIYELTKDDATYPTILSADRPDGTPIPWAALSGLAASSSDTHTMYAIHDSFFVKSRIYTMDIGGHPAIISGETVLSDPSGLLGAAGADTLVNADDMTVNLDAEGIAVRADGGFWIASEGAGTVGDPDEPVTSANLLIRVDAAGVIEEVVALPATTNERQVRFGYEGVVSVGSGGDEVVYVAFQREWADDPAGHVRIGRYAVATGEWTFFYYPIEAPLSANGGWVGLSDLAPVDGDEFMVIERDNQAGPDAVIKRIYRFSFSGLTPLADPPVGTTPTFPVLEKTLVRDLVPDLLAPGGLVLEKVEGLAKTSNDDVVIVTDNDGVDGSNGETQLINLGHIL